MEAGLDKKAVIAELTRSPHGELAQYVPVGMRAAAEDPAFFSHLIAWNHQKGAIRDAKTALPVVALCSGSLALDAELRDNALAHILSLDARNIVRAVRFAKAQPVVSKRSIYGAIAKWFEALERNPGRFDRVALQHRKSLHELVALLHLKPGERAKRVLFERAKIGVFADVAALASMAPDEAAWTIMRKRIPFLVAIGALGKRAKDPAVVQALIGAMSPTELVTNTKLLERLGMKSDPGLRAAYEAGLQRASKSTANVLKATRAAEAVGGAAGEKLRGLQEKQLDAISMDGDWLVLADKSASMQDAIEVARVVAGTLARAGKGKVHLVFFDTSAHCIDVTGKGYDEILALTKRVLAGGGTSIGCGADYAAVRGLPVDGIAIVSDGAENSAPMFASAYAKLAGALGKQVPVYLFWMKCHQPNPYNNDPNALARNCRLADIALDVFDLRSGVDAYSLPNVVQTMRSNRYSLVDEILATPLKTLAEALD